MDDPYKSILSVMLQNEHEIPIQLKFEKHAGHILDGKGQILIFE